MSNLDKFFRPIKRPPGYQRPTIIKMTCEEVSKNLRAYLRRDEAIVETFWSIDAHVRCCTSCRTELQRIQDDKEADQFVMEFYEEATADEPDGGLTCNMAIGMRVVAGVPNTAQLAMQKCWRHYLNDQKSQDPNAERMKFMATSLGGCLAATSDRQEFLELLTQLDAPTASPGLKDAVLAAMEKTRQQ